MSDKVCYSNNGHSMRYVPADHVALEGEILFDDIASPEQLASAFSEYEDATFNEGIKAQLRALELTITDRRRDEAILGTDEGWLALVRSHIDELREQLR